MGKGRGPARIETDEQGEAASPHQPTAIVRSRGSHHHPAHHPAPAAGNGSGEAAVETVATAIAPRTEAPPAAAPITGRIPLPRHRPGGTAVAATGSIGPAGPVPLPRARPAGVPADTPPIGNAPYGYEPGLESGH